MGCMNGKPETFASDVSKIENTVDSQEYLEINVRDLVFHSPNINSSKIWPLNIVRRYGYEGNTFCFEVGRASSYGQGVYSFKCNDVKLVFDSFKRALQLNSLSTLASNLSNELHNICRPLYTQVNDFNKVYDKVSYSRVSKNKKSNNRSPSPYSSRESNSIFLQENIYENVFYNDEENNDLQSKNSDESSEDHLTYTEVEIAACSKPIKKSPTPPETSVYTTIDFIRTTHLSKNLFKCNDNTGVRKTRHDFD